MTFLQKALKIQTEIQSLPLETIGFQTLDSKQQSSVRISQLIADEAKNMDQELQTRLQDEFEGDGPLSQLFADEEVTEIIVNSLDEIWYEKKGQLHRLPDRFASSLTFQNFIERLCQESKVQVSLERPFCDGRFRNFRLHLVSSELTKNDFILTLRRQNKNPWTLDRLLSQGWTSERGYSVVKDWLHQKKSFLVVGETGSGKTSVLNACLQALPQNERIVVLEDTSEIVVPNQASTKLLTRQDCHGLLPTVDLTELLRQSLRMRPDRLVVGEVRGAEAKDLLLALSTGHQGSMGTLHASSAHQAILRLEMLVQLGAPHWSLATIRRLMGLSLNGILVVGRNQKGERRLKSIYELSAVEETGVLLDPIFQEDSEILSFN
ncbi:MAG: CpaF family protein [Pseudobdellovibrionaceae bacterium]